MQSGAFGPGAAGWGHTPAHPLSLGPVLSTEVLPFIQRGSGVSGRRKVLGPPRPADLRNRPGGGSVVSALSPVDSAGCGHQSWPSSQRASSTCRPLLASVLEKCKWEV